jgi:spermidine synthase
MAKAAKASRRERRREQLVERKAERRARAQPRTVVPLLAAAFLVSGSAGLMHEVVWTRLLGHLFGVTEMAIGTVLAAFMGGLAIGSAWIGTRSERLADGRRAYALLEIGIGLLALVVPLLLDLVEPVYGWLWRRYHLSFAVFSVLRFLVASAILLPPTILMGATLPVLAGYLARVEGKTLGAEWLYTANLVGAVVGVAGAGFVLMPAIGLWGTIGTGAALNLAVGLVVLTLPALGERRPAPVAVATGSEARPAVLLAAAAFASGFVSLACQVAWTRVLALIVGSTTYAFTSVLLVYLVALGVGSAWASRRGARVASVGPDLAVMCLLAAGFLLVSIFSVNDLPYFYLHLYDTWGAAAVGGSVARGLVTTVAALFAPVACAGTILPLVLVGVVPPGGRGTGAAVGRIYAVNTAGAIAGSLLTGFVLIPTLGTQATLLGATLVLTATGLAFALTPPRPAWLPAAAAVGAVAIALGMLLRPAWNFQDLQAGVAEPGRLASDAIHQLTDPRERVLYAREGPTASVLANQLPDGSRVLTINGRANASDDPGDMATQVLLARVPLLLAPRADRVFVVGWGSGVTVGSAAALPDTQVTAVEIEPAVVEASDAFLHVNGDPRHNPRVRLFEDDARHILLASEDTYDVIISEPPHPWVAGVSNLFTRDFYRLASRRLAPDGVFAQWLQSYQMSFETYSTIIGTFHTVFPEVLVFNPAETSDTILVGSRVPLTLDLKTLEGRWEVEPVRADLARVGLKRSEDLLATLALGPDGVRRIAAQAPRLNTDNNMAVEFRGPRDMERGMYESVVALFGELARYATPIEALLTDPAPLLGSRERLEALVAALTRGGRDATAYQKLLDRPAAR